MSGEAVVACALSKHERLISGIGEMFPGEKEGKMSKKGNDEVISE